MIATGAPTPAATTSVAVEVADADPAVFVALTTTRIVCPTSLARRRYVGSSAPSISMQAAPDALQSSHWYVNDVGLPDQVPVAAESVWPCLGVPVIFGSVRFAGGTPPAVTTAVSAEVADVEPAVFAAVTTTRIVWPTSLAVRP